MISRHPAEVAFSLAAAANDSTVLICFAVPQPLPGMKREEEEAEAAKGSISSRRRRSISPTQQGQTGLNCVLEAFKLLIWNLQVSIDNDKEECDFDAWAGRSKFEWQKTKFLSKT